MMSHDSYRFIDSQEVRITRILLIGDISLFVLEMGSESVLDSHSINNGGM
jgi:hypothetical protein